MPAQGKQLSLFGMEDVPEEVDEKTQLLRDDLGRVSGFVNGKLRIAEYYEQHQPTDYVNSLYPAEEYRLFLSLL